MNLTLDIGNTRIKAAIFGGDKLLEQQIWESWQLEKILKLATNHSIKNVILSTVAAIPDPNSISLLEENFFFIQLNKDTPIPIENHYKSPNTLGKDRLAAVVGAWHLFPNQNSLVIDAGTCITLDLVESPGYYIGGNISPGVNMRMKAMHHFTSKLPLVERGNTDSWLGYDTNSALINGAQWGAILEIEGFIDKCLKIYQSINIILTGGDAVFLAKKMKRKIFVNQNLVLIGLNKILDYNVK